MSKTHLRGATLLLTMVSVLLVGCLPTYVGDPEKSVIDEKLVGIWQPDSSKDKPEFWALHKMDKHCYFMQMRRTGEKTTTELNGRAWLTEIGGKTFISIELYSLEMLDDEKQNEDITRYMVARIERQGDEMTVRPINPDFLKTNSITTPKAFEDAIRAHLDDDALYTDKPVTFRRATSLEPVTPAAEK